jgi:hypothetical protein
MIYEWECKQCGHRSEVNRSIQDRAVPPNSEEGRHPQEDGSVHNVTWRRVFNSSVPFTALRDRGIFMDENGNYPPRKMD